MQWKQIQAISGVEEYRWEPAGFVTAPPRPSPMVVDSHTVDRAARALFEFVFSSCERLDRKHQWATCDESTKEGFREEAAAVIAAVWPLLFR
jgi:hypothetical protein